MFIFHGHQTIKDEMTLKRYFTFSVVFLLFSFAVNAQLTPFRKRAIKPYTSSFANEVTEPNIIIPSDAKAGNFAILVDTAGGSSLSTNVVPPGWTQIATGTRTFISNIRLTVSGKILSASDPGTTIQGLESAGIGGASAKQLYVFNGTYSGFSVNDLTIQETDSNPGARTVIGASGTVPIIVFSTLQGFPDGDTATVNCTPSAPGCELLGYPTYDTRIGYRSFVSNPRDITFDWPDTGRNIVFDFYIQLNY